MCMLKNHTMETQSLDSTVVSSGDTFPRTGYYGYAGHAQGSDADCFVPPQAKRMIFDKGEKAPLLGGCPHAIKWKFIARYEPL